MATSMQEVRTEVAVVPSGTHSARVRVPLEVYLHTSYQPDCDWVGGELRERNMGEGQHAVVQKFLAMFLGNHEEEWGILALTEQRVQVSATHFRVPDLCVLRGDQEFEPIVRRPPLLCIEILSREDKASDMLEGVDDYRVMGVGTVWLIDPRRRTASMINETGTIAKAGPELTVPETKIRLGLDLLFAQLNRLESR